MSHSTCSHRLLRGLLAAALTALVAAAPVRADGDPASDVLASQPLFLPQDASVSIAASERLAAVLAAANHRGVAARVAVVATRGDLGAITELWGRPETLARFLAAELSLVYRGAVIVVMPQGVGLAGAPGARIASRGSADLAVAATAAVTELAAARGQRLTDVATTGASATGGGTDAVAVIVFALGALAVATAWIASLRARPLRAGL